MRLRLALGVLVLVAGGIAFAPRFAARADEPKKAADKAPGFKADVAPLLNSACSACHAGIKKKAGLDVTSYDSIMKFVKAGEPDKSKLHNSLLGKGSKLMPPKNPLSDDQIAVVNAWIAAGAKKD